MYSVYDKHSFAFAFSMEDVLLKHSLSRYSRHVYNVRPFKAFKYISHFNVISWVTELTPFFG